MGDISNEPSMEDILASIKRIIADDGTSQPDATGGEETKAMADNAELSVDMQPAEVLELGPEQISQEPEPMVAAAPEPEQARKNSILSKASAEASRASLANLSKMIVRQEVDASNTLEGLVRDLLKPMIKPWLDENLPAIVERAVAHEVARLSGRDI